MDTDTEIQIRTRAATNPGPFNIRVEAGDTTSAITPADVFTYVPQPVVSSVSPSSGPTSGGNRGDFRHGFGRSDSGRFRPECGHDRRGLSTQSCG